MDVVPAPVEMLFLQVCVEQCPEKFMTLLEAYDNQNDFDYYKKFCKEDVTTMVSFKPPFKVFHTVYLIFK